MSTTRLVIHSQRMLRRYPVRVMLAASGSLLGIGTLTLVLSLGGAALDRVTRTVDQLFGGSSIGIMAGGTRFLGGPRPGTARLTIDDLAAVAAEVPGIAIWDAQQTLPSATVRRGNTVTTARVTGQTERAREVWNRDVSQGEYFDAQAVATTARVALIGETAARALFGSDDPIGAEILVEAVPFTVIGVLERFGTDLHGMDRDNELVVPVSTLQRRVMNVDTVVQAKLLVSDPDAVATTGEDVVRVLRARHGIPPDRPSDFSVMTADEVRQIVGTVERIIDVYAPLVAVVFAVVAGLVAMVLMLTLVRQRTSEIGVRRAVGARSGQIAVQFTAETAVTVAAGGLAGVLVGNAIAVVVAGQFELDTSFSWSAALTGLAVSVVIGVVAGLLPARRAAGLHPVDALR
jgi:putative ABC transport system permease protein